MPTYETHQLLGSSALNLGNPRQALKHFQDASTAHHSEGEAYDGDAFPRGHAIYLARLAEAHLALGISMPPSTPPTLPSPAWAVSPPHAAPAPLTT
ncbi:hypothetical protein ABZ628_29295 [Streptomyces diastaticus]|uniref:hypothetical protein n=1 Tax=Streptomyces diastaticus TaxID=1956 RepID=UPI00340183C7